MSNGDVWAMCFVSVLAMRLHPRNVKDGTGEEKEVVLREIAFADALADMAVRTAHQKFQKPLEGCN